MPLLGIRQGYASRRTQRSIAGHGGRAGQFKRLTPPPSGMAPAVQLGAHGLGEPLSLVRETGRSARQRVAHPGTSSTRRASTSHRCGPCAAARSPRRRWPPQHRGRGTHAGRRLDHQAGRCRHTRRGTSTPSSRPLSRRAGHMPTLPGFCSQRPNQQCAGGCRRAGSRQLVEGNRERPALGAPRCRHSTHGRGRCAVPASTEPVRAACCTGTPRRRAARRGAASVVPPRTLSQG